MNPKIMMAVATALAGGLSFGAMEIPTEGLLFDLDAQATATLQADDSGFVTNWLSARTDTSFTCVDTTGAFLDPAAFGGRGALVFGRDADDTVRNPTRYLHNNGNLRNQSVIMVLQWDMPKSTRPCMGELYGQTEVDCGIRSDYYCRMYTWGDSLLEHCVTWYNGVKQTKRSAACVSDVIPSGTTDVGKEPYVFCAVMTNDTVAGKTGYGNGTYTPKLGGYSQYSVASKSRFFTGHIAEVIVYDRQLTEAEVDELNDKLMHKWYGTDPKPENTWITVVGSTGSYGTPVPAYGKYVKGELGNAFSIAACLSTDTDGKRIVTADKTANQRSIYLGYEVVNAAGTVLQSSATDESFTFTATEPVTVRWIIRRECRAALTAGENGQVAVAGGTPGASDEAWQYAGTKVRVQAIPADGYHLAYWKGDVDGVDILNPDQKIVIGGETQLEAVFAPGAPEYPKMLTRGLVFKIDATDPDSVRTDADGYVTNWFSRVGEMPFDINVTGVKPFVQADALGGHGSVRFGLQKDGSTLANTPLKASVLGRAPVRTFLIALSQVKNAGDMTYPLGYTTTECYGLVCYLGGRLYNRSFIDEGRVWMDDGSLRQYPGKMTGKPTSAYVAQFGDTKNVTHVLVCEDRDETATDGTILLGLGNAISDPANSSYVKRCFPGDMGEVAGYDRKLSPAEVRYVMAFMNKKWKGESFDLPKWTAATTVSADATYANLLLDGASTVTVAAGKTLTVNNLLVVSSDVTFCLEKGATLQIPEIVKYDPDAVVSFELDDARLVFVEEGNAYAYDQECNKDVYSRCGSPLNLTDDLTAYQPLAWPGPVTGTGTVRLAGARPLKLAATDVIPDNLSWELLSGTLDLNGRSLVAADVRGPARLVNTADAAVTLTVGRDSAFALEPRLAGKVSVVRQGTGDLSLGGVSTADGALTLGSGKTALSLDTFAPGSISNLVCHLDASRPETLHFGDDGRVIQWDSLAGDGAVFVERFGPSYRKPQGKYYYRGPGYDAAAMDGKPGLLFHVDADFNTASSTNSLFADRAFVGKTVIAVVKPKNTPGGEGTHWGHIWAQANYGGLDYNGTCLKFENWLDGSENGWHWGAKDSSTTGRVCVNGKMYFDVEAGVDESRFCSSSFGKPQVFAQSFASGNYSYTPAVGSLCDHIRNFVGVISEIVVYSHSLTAEELQRVETALMAKWGIEPFEGAILASGDHLSKTGDLTLGASATLDLGGMTNHVATFTGGGALANGTLIAGAARITDNLSADGFYTPALTYAALGNSYPEIALKGGWDLTGTDLVLEDAGTAVSYASLIRSSSGGLIGPFKSAPARISVTPRRASFGTRGMTLIIR